MTAKSLRNETSSDFLTELLKVEARAKSVLRSTESNYTLVDIRRLIYEEQDSHALFSIIPFFDTGKGGYQLKDIIELATEMWNYFPHKSLGGSSPHEMALKSKRKHQGEYIEYVLTPE